MNYPESRLRDLAKHDPAQLISLIESGELDAVDLTWAGEALNEAPADVAVPALLKLLEHPSAVAREGAIYGLTGHLRELGVLAALGRHLDPELEPSEAIREIAAESIGYLDHDVWAGG